MLVVVHSLAYAHRWDDGKPRQDSQGITNAEGKVKYTGTVQTGKVVCVYVEM